MKRSILTSIILLALSLMSIRADPEKRVTLHIYNHTTNAMLVSMYWLPDPEDNQAMSLECGIEAGGVGVMVLDKDILQTWDEIGGIIVAESRVPSPGGGSDYHRGVLLDIDWVHLSKWKSLSLHVFHYPVSEPLHETWYLLTPIAKHTGKDKHT